jgi:hypothetical protein
MTNLEKEKEALSNIQNIIDLLHDAGYSPNDEDLYYIFNGILERRDNYLDIYLREQTVKKHPAIDTLPITKFMKTTMIELPKECKKILDAYDSIIQKQTVKGIAPYLHISYFKPTVAIAKPR